MKFFSDITKRFYETPEDCMEAESAALKEKEAAENEKRKAAEMRKNRAAEVEKARDDYLNARKVYNDLLKKFCADYGSYHCSIKSPDEFGDYFDALFKLL